MNKFAKIGIIVSISVIVAIGSVFAMLDNSGFKAAVTKHAQMDPITFLQLIDYSDVILLGKIINVETKVVDISYDSNIVLPDDRESTVTVHNDLHEPFQFVTVEVEEYFKGDPNDESLMITFRDYASGEGIKDGEKVLFERTVMGSYRTGERAIFFIEDRDSGWFSNGFVAKFSIGNDDKVNSKYYEQTGIEEPIDVEDAKNKIQTVVAGEEAVDALLQTSDARQKLSSILNDLNNDSIPNVDEDDVESYAIHFLKEQAFSGVEPSINSEQIKSAIKESRLGFKGDVDVVPGPTQVLEIEK